MVWILCALMYLSELGGWSFSHPWMVCQTRSSWFQRVLVKSSRQESGLNRSEGEFQGEMSSLVHPPPTHLSHTSDQSLCCGLLGRQSWASSPPPLCTSVLASVLTLVKLQLISRERHEVESFAWLPLFPDWGLCCHSVQSMNSARSWVLPKAMAGGRSFYQKQSFCWRSCIENLIMGLFLDAHCRSTFIYTYSHFLLPVTSSWKMTFWK